MFLDASAIIAILGDEDDAASMLARLEAMRSELHYSPVSVYEAVIGLARKKSGKGSNDAHIPHHLIDQAETIVRRFLNELGAREIPITAETARLAVAACKTYGRAVGHPAKLNMGDCFAYACARSLGVPLLYKGNDFPHTDIG
jgi:ribonuclease VapC